VLHAGECAVDCEVRGQTAFDISSTVILCILLATTVFCGHGILDWTV